MLIRLAAIVGLFASAALAGRFDQYTARFKNPPDGATVVGATYFGGGGTEWLSGGGFAPDGTIVAAGVTLGPTFDAPVKVTVLGTDAQPPAAPQPVADKKPNKDGSPKYLPFKWTHENATGFVVRYSADLKQVKSVSRLPWKSAGVTAACVDAAGSIYIAGPATDAVGKLSKDFREQPAGAADQKGQTDHTYLAKLDPDAGKVLWVRSFKGPSIAPAVRLNKAGQIIFTGPDIRTFDSAGKQLSVTQVPGGLSGNVAVSPIDGTIARGGEHHWPTGREPYRCPILNLHKPTGELQYHLYNWPGPYVGLDNLRLVSDTAVRGVMFDDDGNLFISAWSDGGNSVMNYQPTDVRRPHGAFERGLGFSAWGANVLSAAYLCKIDPKTLQVTDGTLWLAYLGGDKDKPNSLWVDAMALAGDGSMCVAGRSAWGLIRTGNDLSDNAPPAGTYVAVFSKDFKSLRFCSTVAAAGKADVNAEQWGIVHGNGRVMFLSGAIEKEEFYGETRPAPTKNAPQEKFGGGFLDGHLLVLDLNQEGK